MSAGPVIAYAVGIGVFGFAYWLLDGVLSLFIDVAYHQTGDVYNFLMYVWLGSLVVYLIFGGIWVARKYNELEYQRGW